MTEYDLVLPGTGGRYPIALAAARRFVKKAKENGLTIRNIYAASGGVFGAVHISAGYEDPQEWVRAHWKKTAKFKLGGWRFFQQAYNLLFNRGLFSWHAVRKVFTTAHPHKDLQTPIWIVVWDLSRDRELLLPVHEWKDNNIGEAMAVSCALPIMITPPRLRVKDFPASIQTEMLEDCGPNDYITLVDGGLSSDAPADIASELGFAPIPSVVISLGTTDGYARDVGKGSVLDHMVQIIKASLSANSQEDLQSTQQPIFNLRIDAHGFGDQTLKFNMTEDTGLKMIDRGVGEMNKILRERSHIFDEIKKAAKKQAPKASTKSPHHQGSQRKP
jgi:predicted acylesterase/phospholipase RssA